MALINFSGIASGIDSSSLIKALLDKERAARISPLEKKVSSLEDTNSAFGELSDLLSKLKTSSAKFRALNGSAISKSVTSSDETVATATASGAATNGQYTLTVSTLAKNGTYSFNDRFASDTTAIDSGIVDGDPAVDRTVTVTLGTGAEQESIGIELTSTTTAGEFVTQFNAQSTQGSASLVNVGTSASPSYAIVISSNNEGTEEGQIGVSVGSSITGAGAFTAGTLSQATDATFTVSGISGTITRSSNTVNDVISGVSLNLSEVGAATVTVGNDSSATAATLQEFVDAYNEVVNYVRENDLVTREESGSEVSNLFAPLASTSIDENILSALRSSLGSATTSGGAVSVLADLGITTQRDGTLKFDTDTFNTALADDPNGVQAITEALGEDLASVGGTIDQFIQFGGLIDQSENSNKTEITSANSRIAEIEQNLSRQEESLIRQFARLESLIGQLNSQQSALSGLLP